MPKRYKVKLLKDIKWNINDFSYIRGQELDVVEIDSCFEDNYAHYYKGTLDWIPKHLVKVVN